MKKVQKSICFAMSILMMMSIVSGCGNNNSEADQRQEIVDVLTNNTQAKTVSDSPVSDKGVTTEENMPTDNKGTQNVSLGEFAVNEKVLVDDKGVKITAKNIDNSGWLGPELKLLIENNTEKSLTVQVRHESVNGFMVSSMMSEDVAAGKKANSGVVLTASELEACGINTITDIELSFHIFYSDNWDTYLDTDMVKLETSVAGTYIQPVDDSGKELFNKNGIKIIGKGISADDSVFGPGLIIYIENNTDKNITVQARDTSINGFMIDGSMSQEVTPGKKAITALTFFTSTLQENGITKIESIETSFHVFDTDSWNDIVNTDTVTLTF